MNVRNLVLSVLSVFAIGSQAHAGVLLEHILAITFRENTNTAVAATTPSAA